MSKKIAVAVFVKTPGITPAKTRLAKTIGTPAAEAFYVQLLDVCRAWMAELSNGNFLGCELTPLWAVAEQDQRGAWTDFASVSQGAADLGSRLSKVYDTCLARFPDGVILVGADCPLMGSKHLVAAARRLEEVPFVIGPSTDGGFYLFASNQQISLAEWQSVPYSDATTAMALMRGLGQRGAISQLEELRDVDEYDDLVYLARTLGQQAKGESLVELSKFLRQLEVQVHDKA